MTFNLIEKLPISNRLGEGVLWNEETQMVWWTDIEDKKLFSYCLNSQVLDQYEMPERLCSFAFLEESLSFLAAFETGLAIYDPVGRSVRWIESIYKKGCGTRLNDGRVDRQGRFWVGAMIESSRDEVIPANLFRYAGDGILTVHETEIQISNSLCWSPDGRTLYFADSPKNTIYAFDMDIDKGTINNKRIFATTNQGIHPDGSCVDSEGFLWNAQWGAGQVVRYSPDGDLDLVLKVPSLQPTCVTFGGPELTHLIVTSARLDMNSEEIKNHPLSGGLFIYHTSFKGLAEQRFKFKI